MLNRLGRWCHNRRGIVVIGWLAVLFVTGGVSGALGSGFSTEFSPPDVESARGLEVLDEHFGGQGGGNGGSIVFRSERAVTDPAVQGPMSEFFAKVDGVRELAVVSPYTPEGAQQVSRRPGTAERIAFAAVDVPRGVTIEDAAEITKEVQALEPDIDGVQIEYGGQLFAKFTPPQSEALGLGFAIVILILAFGSVLAMGLPIATAAGGIGVGTVLVAILSNVIEMPNFTSTLGIMIGLGVGIDYALFIVTRYREALHAGLDTERAAGIALNTAGRAVIFAGATVVISLLGMLLMGLTFVNGLAIGAAITVLFTMLASITLLPALLGFAGSRLEVTRWRGLVAAGLVALALIGLGLKLFAAFALLPVAVVVLIVLIAGSLAGPLRRPLPQRASKPADQTVAYRWSRFIQAHPWLSVGAGAAVLVVLALPLLSIRLGFSDEGNLPEDTTTRRAYDLLAEGFGPGYSGPLLVVAELPDGVGLDRLASVMPALQSDPGVAFATPAVPNDPTTPTAALWRVVPSSAPQDEATSDLVHRLRDDVLPSALEGTGVEPAVTGFVAVSVDFSKYLGDRLPLFVGVVLLLSFLLLMTVFRSLLVPLKAVVMNLASIGASYGLVVAVFQWGWAKELVGVGKGGPIEPFVPMMMFAIVFGLSMDYEVFLLSRIKEEYDRGASNARAVADGLAATARVITAAAAIMVFVFGSFLLESDRVIKLFGVGLASAVLLDATLGRMLLVPATMELLGDRNWWLPGWLGRLLPKIDVDAIGDDGADAISHAPDDEREPEPVGS